MIFLLFWFSGQQGAASNELSGKISGQIAQLLEPVLRHVTNMPMWMLKDEINTGIRKLAHFFAYSFLGMLMLIAVKAYAPCLKRPVKYLTVLAIVVVLACLDEVHQAFIAGRNSSLLDVGIDVCGALFAFVCVGLVRLLSRLDQYMSRKFAPGPDRIGRKGSGD